MKRRHLLLLVALLASRVLAVGTPPADAERLDYEACRKLVDAGEILSMMELMGRVTELSGGQMLDGVLLRVGESYIYELEVAGIDGVVRMLYVDARTGSLFEF